MDITLSPQERFAVNFFGHIESIANLPGAETHWQDNWRKSAGFSVDQGKRQAVLMGGVLQQAAPVNGETVDHPPVGMWSEVVS